MGDERGVTRNLPREIRSLLDFDNHFVAPVNGFKDAREYSATLPRRRCPARSAARTLLIHAQDDPWIRGCRELSAESTPQSHVADPAFRRPCRLPRPSAPMPCSWHDPGVWRSSSACDGLTSSALPSAARRPRPPNTVKIPSAPGAGLHISDLQHALVVVEPAIGAAALIICSSETWSRRDGRHLERLLHPPEHVEIGQARLHHQHVRALGDVERRLAQRLVAIRRDPSDRCACRRGPSADFDPTASRKGP